MKVLHLSGAPRGTGSGYAAVLTHQALLESGIDSRLLFLNDLPTNDPTIFRFADSSRIRTIERFLVTTLERTPTWLYPRRKSQLFSTGLLGLKLRENPLLKWADLIHIHWPNHGLISLREIAKWGKPVVWTLRDMWAFTGGCHYAQNCDKYKTICGKCPALGSARDKDLSTIGFSSKLQHLANSSIVWVAISTWMQARALESAVLRGKTINLIPSGVDCGSFKPTNQQQARRDRGLPLAKKIILVGAANLTDEAKGFAYVINSLRKLPANICIATFGGGQIQSEQVNKTVFNFGYISNSKILAELYNAADVFLGPSISEAFGKTFAEAQSCGLPAVCFADSGPADIVTHRTSGYLARMGDSDDLDAGIKYCLNARFNREEISNRARQRFDIRVTAESYCHLYRSVLHESGKP